MPSLSTTSFRLLQEEVGHNLGHGTKLSEQDVAVAMATGPG